MAKKQGGKKGNQLPNNRPDVVIKSAAVSLKRAAIESAIRKAAFDNNPPELLELFEA